MSAWNVKQIWIENWDRQRQSIKSTLYYRTIYKEEEIFSLFSVFALSRCCAEMKSICKMNEDELLG